MPQLITPYQSDRLLPRLVADPKEREELKKEALTLPIIPMSTKETSDLLMLGIGAFTPLRGFMDAADWLGVCRYMALQNKPSHFWPIPITLAVCNDLAKRLANSSKAALMDIETQEILGIINIQDIFCYDKKIECSEVFRTMDTAHPGVKKIMSQPDNYVGGPVLVFSESYYPTTYGELYQTPAEARLEFQKRGWNTIAALQLRNPMHNSHLYLAKIACEVCDGLYVHQLVGKLKDDDIPAEVRVRAVEAVVAKRLRADRVVIGGYPFEMRYAGPREALLHALFRQNYGCTHMIIGRDHAGVGNYYGSFEAQNIFTDSFVSMSLQIKPLCLDWTFYCHGCGEMASMKTCPHSDPVKLDDEGNVLSGHRLLLSGTLLRKFLSEDKKLPAFFTDSEAEKILREYYRGLKKTT